MKIQNLLKKVFNFRYNRAIQYKNLFLPDFRSNENLNHNAAYLQSAINQIDHLVDYCDLTKDSRILDFGCGQGRLLNGITHLQKKFSTYEGLDTKMDSINWCNRWLSDYTGKFEFIYLPAFNARYNKTANGLMPLPFDEAQYDIIFLNSVFSHMLSDDIIFYLNEFYRVIQRGGMIYLTAFIEENVCEIEENPDNYIDESSGRLHRVRYEKNFFYNLVQDAGFKINNFMHHEIDRTKQSVLIIEKI